MRAALATAAVGLTGTSMRRAWRWPRGDGALAGHLMGIVGDGH